MLATASLNGGLGGKAPTWAASGRLACDAVVYRRVPDEVYVKHGPEIVAGFSLFLPGLEPCSIERPPNFIARTVLRRVNVKQVADVFDHLIADLDSHALLR